MTHEAGHTDMVQFGGFKKGKYVIVRTPMSIGSYGDLDPGGYGQFTQSIAGSTDDPVVGLAFLMGHSRGWQDRIRWKPDPEGEDWQRLQWMLKNEGDDPDNPQGGDGRHYLQGLGVKVVAYFESGYGGYRHPQRDALGISSVRGAMGEIISEEVVSGPVTPGGSTPPEGGADPDDAGLIWPCCGVITTTHDGHLARGTGLGGLDVDCGDNGEPLVAAHGGTVVFAGGNPVTSYGLYVDIVNTTIGIGTRYGHMLPPHLVTVGQQVVQGDVIGLMDNTGNSDGPHIHFEVHSPISASQPLSNATTVDPLLYLPSDCADAPVGELPPGVQDPATSYTTYTVEGLDGTLIDFVGDEWRDNPDGGTAPVWRKLQSLVAMLHWRSRILGPSPILIGVDGPSPGTGWQPVDAYNAVNGNNFLSPRSFWAPRVNAVDGASVIIPSWQNWAYDDLLGLSYGRCELIVDVDGANPTHIANIHAAAGGGISVSGLQGAAPAAVETVTSGIIFYDDMEKILDQGLAQAVRGLVNDGLSFWNYGNKWDKLVNKWNVFMVVADQEVLTSSGDTVSIDNEPYLMPNMVVGDFFGRILFERMDWKTGDREPNLMWFENMDWCPGSSAPPGFYEVERGDLVSEDFGTFYFELTRRDGTFTLTRFPFATASFPPGIFFGTELLGSEWAYFGSAGLGGIHGWHMYLEKGIQGEGAIDSPDLVMFPVDPRTMDRDHGVVEASPSATLGDLKTVAVFPSRNANNSQPYSRIIAPLGSAASPIGLTQCRVKEEFLNPFIHDIAVTPLTPAPGAFIPAPVAPLPGEPPLDPGVDEVYISGNTTIIGAYQVNNSILNRLYQDLLGNTVDGKGNYELAAYIAVMLEESGGRPASTGVCVMGVGRAYGLFQLLTGADPSCPGSGGMGHPYSGSQLMNVPNNINIARNELLDSWQGAVAQGGNPPPPGVLGNAFCSNGWAVGCPSEGAPFNSRWMAIRDGIDDLDFPLPA